MNAKATEARKAYMKQWRDKNREHLRHYSAEWRKNNPDKVAKHIEDYWIRQADRAADRLAQAISEEQENNTELYAN